VPGVYLDGSVNLLLHSSIIESSQPRTKKVGPNKNGKDGLPKRQLDEADGKEPTDEPKGTTKHFKTD
jgi:hypothetical protein